MKTKSFRRLLINTIHAKSNILYMGCEDGQVISELNPKYGLGIPNKKGNRPLTKKIYTNVSFETKDVLEIQSEIKFDYIILDEALSHFIDVYSTLKHIRAMTKEDGKIIINSIPKITLIKSILDLFKKKNFKKIDNWIPKQLLETLLYLSNFWPRPEVGSCIIADAIEPKTRKEYSCSIIIPAYNEEGNIAECVRRIPKMKRDYEIIIINDGSRDKTSEVVREMLKDDNRIKFIDYKNNKGKGYATKIGMDAATKDILMILDADMTVRPEDLLLFIDVFDYRNAEFVNGTRMVYPMQDQAMRSIKVFGNKIFSIIFSYILNQNVTDTLCGTKCMFRKDYKRIIMKDNSWPDFDLLFGAAKNNLKIVEMPIWYQKRVVGESKMKVIKHGLMLLKASARGLLELKILRR
ncbi:MAG: hypothetical protein A2Y79_09885 [Deltaproteobacteria bacterium RBG_13_43_22]|nr:MAG: hypothetical protein A2Y79_09885 [Deltaproteobacteria bacterium RBG_13_43_22]